MYPRPRCLGWGGAGLKNVPSRTQFTQCQLGVLCFHGWEDLKLKLQRLLASKDRNSHWLRNVSSEFHWGEPGSFHFKE